MRQVFCGLDIETTASDYNKGALIQIGISSEDGFEFCMDVNPFKSYEPWQIEKAWEEEARAVNGFTDERVAAAWSTETVEETLLDAIQEHYGSEKFRFIAVGWNVGSFDLPFVIRAFPKFSKYLSYRSCDLNAVLFTLDRARRGMKGVLRYDGLKKAAKNHAAEVLAAKGVGAGWHDAYYDAHAAMVSWGWLQKKVMVTD